MGAEGPAGSASPSPSGRLRNLARDSLITLNPRLLLAALVLIAIGVNTLTYRSTIASITADQEAAETEMRRQAEQLLLTFDHLLEPVINEIGVLQALSGEVGLDIEAGDVSRTEHDIARLDLAVQVAKLPVRQIGTIDETGHLTWSNLTGTSNHVDLSDRSHIQAILNGRRSFVSTPVTGRVSNEATVQFSAPILDAHGMRHGVSVVSMDAHMLRGLAEGLKLQQADFVSLVRSDGALLMGITPTMPHYTTALDLVNAAFRNGHASGIGLAHVDGRDRYFSIMRLNNPDLALLLAVDVQEALKPNVQQNALRLRMLWIVMAVTTLAIGLIGVVIILLRSMVQRSQAREALGASTRRLANLIGVSPGVLFCGRLLPDGLRIEAAYGNAALGNIPLPGVEVAAPREPIQVVRRLAETISGADCTVIGRQLQGGRTAHLDVTIGSETDRSGSHWVRLVMRRITDSATSASRSAGVPVVGFVADVTAEHTGQAVMAEVSRLVSIGEMATSLAHELAQPLATIQLAAENSSSMLRRPQPDLAKVQVKLDRIERDAIRAGKVMNHIRNLAHSAPLAAGQTSMSDVITTVVEMQQLRLDQERIQLTVLYDDLPPMVASEPVPLEQVIINLIGNAIDAYRGNTRNPREITVLVRHCENWLIVEVSDRAGGIPEAMIGRIFEPFVSTKKQGEGTGLGLAISRSIITNIGGQIDVRNTADGACFTLTLPAVVTA